MYKVILSPEARAFYSQANKPLASKLARCFGQLETEPRRHNNIKRLSGKFAGLSRFRIGDWRVLFRIDDQAQEVHVLLVAHRSEIYE